MRDIIGVVDIIIVCFLVTVLALSLYNIVANYDYHIKCANFEVSSHLHT